MMSTSNNASVTHPGTLDPDFGIDGVEVLQEILKDHGDFTVRYRFKGLATAVDGKLCSVPACIEMATTTTYTA